MEEFVYHALTVVGEIAREIADDSELSVCEFKEELRFRFEFEFLRESFREETRL